MSYFRNIKYKYCECSASVTLFRPHIKDTDFASTLQYSSYSFENVYTYVIAWREVLVFMARVPLLTVQQQEIDHLLLVVTEININ